MLRDVILLLALGPLVFYAMVLWVAIPYFGRLRKRANSASRSCTPPVSILKPVRGLDPEAYENFASFCRLDYPCYEILFCVADHNDPAIPVIENLRQEFPDRSIRLLIGAHALGASGKVNKLCRLVREASYEFLVISDSDIRVERSYLRDVTAPFADSKVGAVTVFFRSLVNGSAGATLDAVGAAVEFASNALLAQELEGIHFTLGATMATTKRHLAEIGGFEALVDHYVDDHELGDRIARQGYRIELAETPVSMVYPSESLLQFFRHELRWTIGLRNARPGGHAAIFLTFGLLWTTLAAVVAPRPLGMFYVVGYLVLRYALYLTVGVWGLRDDTVRRKWWLAPVRDAVNLAVWLASFFTNRITWRGLEFEVSHGLLTPLGGNGESAAIFQDLTVEKSIPPPKIAPAMEENVTL